MKAMIMLVLLKAAALPVTQPNVDEALRQLRAAGIKAVGCAANVGNKADLKRLVELAADTYGSVDALVSNAAVNPSAGLILDMPDSAIDKILDVNVKSAILLVREARPHLRKVGPSRRQDSACERDCASSNCA